MSKSGSSCRRPNTKRAIAVLLVLAAILVACAPAHAQTAILVEWKTATEIDAAGFNLYRAESADGPFVQINSQLIPASNDRLVGGAYQYTDSDVLPGKTYYYQLEDIELGGTATRHGPVVFTAPMGSSSDGWLVIGGGLAVGLIVVTAVRQGRKR